MIPVRYEAMLHGCGTSPLARGLVPTCDSVHSRRLYSAASVGGTSGRQPDNAERQARTQQVSIIKSLVSLDRVLKMWSPDSNTRPSDSLISQNGRQTLYSFGHPNRVGGVCMGSLHRCIVACTHLGNDTDRRTATLAAPLLLQ